MIDAPEHLDLEPIKAIYDKSRTTVDRRALRATVQEIETLRAENERLRAGGEELFRRVQDGSAHVLHCNAISGQVGCGVCSCPLGHELKDLRATITRLTAERDEASKRCNEWKLEAENQVHRKREGRAALQARLATVEAERDGIEADTIERCAQIVEALATNAPTAIRTASALRSLDKKEKENG